MALQNWFFTSHVLWVMVKPSIYCKESRCSEHDIQVGSHSTQESQGHINHWQAVTLQQGSRTLIAISLWNEQKYFYLFGEEKEESALWKECENEEVERRNIGKTGPETATLSRLCATIHSGHVLSPISTGRVGDCALGCVNFIQWPEEARTRDQST